MSDIVYYAIGDVHGEIERLDTLIGCIRADASGAPYQIVLLGDLIDRGPDSRAVIARAKQLSEQGELAAIKGNHEAMMLHAFAKSDSMGVYYWAENGGDETIASYKRANGDRDDWRDAVDRPHIAWLRDLPVMIRDEARGLVFVHGGIDPWRFPNCADEVKLWTRSETFFRSGDWPKRDELMDISFVVHGHTPTDDFEPDWQPRRINVDTGVCYGGPLTCVVLAPGADPRFLRA